MIAMTVAYPDREVPVVPPATAVIGPRAGPAAVVGPAALVPGSASVIVTGTVPGKRLQFQINYTD